MEEVAATPVVAPVEEVAAPVEEVAAPVVEEVAAPVVEEVAAPAVEEVAAPVVEEVAAPVVEEVAAPVVEEVAAPVVEEVAAPVVEEVAAPVVEEVAAPVVEEVAAPVVEEVAAPVVEDVAAPVVEEVAAPVVEEVAAPVVVEEAPVVEEVGAEEVKPAETATEEAVGDACCTPKGCTTEQAKPAVAPAPSAGVNVGAGDAEDAAGKQTRAQKKMMKAMSKLNLKHVPGIMKVVMRRKGNILFSIHGGEVYKAPGSDTYIVFGEAQPEDLISASQRNAVKNITKATEAAKKPEIIEEDPAAEEDDETIDTEGVEEKDIELVMQQAGVTRGKAVKALKKNSNDIVNAIMELTM